MAAQRIPLKDQLFTREKVQLIASEIQRVHPAFRAHEFVAAAVARFPELELKARIDWIATCLEGHLPSDLRPAVGVLLRSLPAPVDPSLSDGDFGDFIYAPYATYVARHGCTADDLDFSLAALREITTRFSAEFAIRPFLNVFPGRVLATLQVWTEDEHYHVRRLCSEGTRPRLPWAGSLMLPYHVGIPLLDRLFADPTRYVTRSVANHVNDISRKDPQLALDTLERWRSLGHQQPREMGYLIRHAARTLVRADHPRALDLVNSALVQRPSGARRGAAVQMTRAGGAQPGPVRTGL
jgi:3-methyladenine DNA glycosylase AlkC